MLRNNYMYLGKPPLLLKKFNNFRKDLFNTYFKAHNRIKGSIQIAYIITPLRWGFNQNSKNEKQTVTREETIYIITCFYWIRSL